MFAAYDLKLSHKIVSAKNTLAKLLNNMEIKVTSGNSVKWIIIWALEQMKPDVLWICIQCFDRIGFIEVWVAGAKDASVISLLCGSYGTW